MPSLAVMVASGATLIAAGSKDAQAQLIAAPSGEQWSTTFSDQFSNNNSSADLAPFSYDMGNNGGWGNNELEVYTNSSQNVSVSGGNLNIDAIATGTGKNETYTSGRIKTVNSFSQTYGLFQFSAALPAGTGLWPAVWMLAANAPSSSEPTYGAWPTSGEIDIVESTGQNTQLVQGSLHSGPNTGTDDTLTQTYAGSGVEPAGFSTTAFHTYDLLWQLLPDNQVSGGQQAELSWYVDGKLYETQEGGWYVPPGAPPEAPFNQPFYLILDLAVGGTYGGTPNLADGTYGMEVQYLEAFQATAVPEPATAAAMGMFLAGFVLHRPKRH